MPQPPDVALAHYSDRQSLVAAGAEVAGQMWAEVNPDRIVESWTAQVPELTAVLSGAQIGAARQADPYLDEVSAWQDLDPATASPIDPRAFAGVASDGRGLMSLLMSPAFSALQVIASGLGSMQGLSLGRQHLDTIARTQVADAGRLADGVALAARRGIDGYVRVVVGKTCSRCIALAGKHYRWSAGFKRHPHCDCIHLPSAIAGSGKLIQNPHRLYESMTAKERQRAGWSLADQQAIADGADLAQITNAHRGVYTAGGRRFTTEGTTKRGFARSRLGKRARMTPEQIYAEAADRDEALRLLYDHGYLVNEPALVWRESLRLAGGDAPTGLAGPGKRAAARARQAEIDRRSKVADLLAELDSLVAKKADAAIFRQRLAMAASDGVDPAILAKLAGPIDSGNMTALRGAITRTGKAEGLTPISKAGDKVRFDEQLHDPLGEMPATGAQVVVVRRGTVLELNGEQITLERAHTSLVGMPAKKATTAAAGDLSKLTVPKLRELAKERGVAIPAKALKADIVKLLESPPAKKVATKTAATKATPPKTPVKAKPSTGAQPRAPRVETLPRSAAPSPRQAAQATNPKFGTTQGMSHPSYREAGKAGERWTPALGPLPYGAYEENCSNVVYAFEMRMRGYDVEAAPLDVLDKYGYAAGRTIEEMDQLLADAWRLPDGRPHGRTLAGQAWRSFAEIDAEIVEHWPDGGRGAIFVGKHIFSVVKVRGKAQYVEAQFDVNASRTVTALYRKKYGGSGMFSGPPQEAKLLRLDDLVPADGILEAVRGVEG